VSQFSYKRYVEDLVRFYAFLLRLMHNLEESATRQPNRFAQFYESKTSRSYKELVDNVLFIACFVMLIVMMAWHPFG
jgi:hypothetical protein